MSNAWSGSLRTGTRCRLPPQTSFNLPRRSAPWSDPARIFLALVLGVFVGALVPATAGLGPMGLGPIAGRGSRQRGGSARGLGRKVDRGPGRRHPPRRAGQYPRRGLRQPGNARGYFLRPAFRFFQRTTPRREARGSPPCFSPAWPADCFSTCSSRSLSSCEPSADSVRGPTTGPCSPPSRPPCHPPRCR